MFLRFLEKCSFNLCLNLLGEFNNFSSVGKLFQTIGFRKDKFVWSDHVSLKDVSVSKQTIAYLLDFDQIDYIYQENRENKFP